MRARSRVELLVLAICLIVSSLAPAQAPARVINGAGSFVRVKDGWRCAATQPKFVPPQLSQMNVGDVLVRIGDFDLRGESPLLLAEGVRRAELGLVTNASIVRGSETISLVAPPAGDKQESAPEITLAQDSPVVLRSSVKGVSAGDRLESISGKSWDWIENTFRANSSTVFININFKPSSMVTITRRGKTSEVVAERGATVVGVRVPKLIGDDAGLVRFLGELTLHGVNTADYSLRNADGKWLLVHFWASWCPSCVVEAPSIAELAKRKDLVVVAVGYSDTEDRLKAFSERLPGFPVYAPDAALTSELAVNGVPFDVLISPDGKPVAAVSGTLPEGLVQKLVLSYLEPPTEH